MVLSGQALAMTLGQWIVLTGGGPRQPVSEPLKSRVSGQEVIEVPGAGHVVAGDVGNVHGDRPGGESGSIGRLGHAGVTSRMSHD